MVNTLLHILLALSVTNQQVIYYTIGITNLQLFIFLSECRKTYPLFGNLRAGMTLLHICFYKIIKINLLQEHKNPFPWHFSSCHTRVSCKSVTVSLSHSHCMTYICNKMPQILIVLVWLEHSVFESDRSYSMKWDPKQTRMLVSCISWVEVF